VQGDVRFEPVRAADLPLVHQWLRRPHVEQWWREGETYEEVVEHYLPSIEGRDPTRLYLIVLDARPVGFIQTYLVSDYPEWETLVRMGVGVAGVDLFIGEPELTGAGLGTAALAQFVREIVFATPSTNACVADPDVANRASLRAFEKAGFRRVREFVDPEDGRTHALLRLDRGQ
jgi:RimJ/RimL family protein N-acetyltransferase